MRGNYGVTHGKSRDAKLCFRDYTPIIQQTAWTQKGVRTSGLNYVQTKLQGDFPILPTQWTLFRYFISDSIPTKIYADFRVEQWILKKVWDQL